MPYNPGVSLFVSFYNSDPARSRQCIYFTQKGSRCRHDCSQSDSTQATALLNATKVQSREDLSLELLSHYILLRCCKAGRHRQRIVDADLLIPLALRWEDEINRNSPFDLSSCYEASPATHSVPRRPVVGSVNSHSTDGASLTYCQPDNSSPFLESAIRAETTGPTPRSSPTESLAAPTDGYGLVQTQTRYSLRSREINIPANSTLAALDSTKQPLSEFAPHKPSSRHMDSVSSRMRVEFRNQETGSLYIFDRTSSPGHVKIGFTSVSVPSRLRQWSQCGYTPNLVFSVTGVPHAKQVETLVHHELIRSWRRERQCKGCGRSHQEWFEIGKERAVSVVRSWADFMKEAQPYDSKGLLRSPWREVVERMDRLGEPVTGERMLAFSRASVLRTLIPVPLLTDSARLSYRLNRWEVPKRRRPTLIEEPLLPERTTLDEGVLFLVPDPEDIPASKVEETEEQIKIEDDDEDGRPSKAVLVKQEASRDHSPLPPSRTPVLRANHQTTPFVQQTRLETLEETVSEALDRVCTGPPMGYANRAVPGMVESLGNEAPQPVATVA